MQEVGNTFTASFKGAGSAYWTAVLSVGGAYWALGTVLFVIFALVLAAYAGCHPKLRTIVPRSCLTVLVSCLFAPRLWFNISALGMLGAAFAGLGLIHKYKSFADKASVAITTLTAAVRTANAHSNWLV